MQSPILQAEEQGRVVKELLVAQTENLLGKILGSVQRGFGYCPVLTYVAVSDSGMIDRKDIVAGLYKADDAVKAVTSKFYELKKSADPRSPKFWLSTEVGWRMKLEEAKAVAEFLVSQHQPKLQVISEKNNKKEPLPKVMPRQIESAVVSQAIPSYEVRGTSVITFIGEGMPCPKCGIGKKIRRKGKSGKPDFFGCSNYGKTKCNFTEPII